MHMINNVLKIKDTIKIMLTRHIYYMKDKSMSLW